MKVLFINPPAPEGIKIVREGRCMQRGGAWTAIWPPVSLATTASLLRKNGHRIKLFDCITEEISAGELTGIARRFGPELAVLNTATPSIMSDIGLAASLKRALPELKTLAFGIHVSALPEKCLIDEPLLDIAVVGEPEMTVLNVANALERSGGAREALESVPGIVYRYGRKLKRTPPAPPIEDLDILPFPAWDQINPGNHLMPFKGRPFFLVSTSRGCPYMCNYCAASAYYGKKPRFRNPVKVVDEMEWAFSEFGVRDFLFWAESFTLNRDFASAVCEEILRRRLDFEWVCNSRADAVDDKLLALLKKAGCWMIGFGIESGNQRILDSIGKNISLEAIRRGVRLAKEAGLEVTGHMIVGLPGETEETILETFKFAVELDLDFAQFYCAVPFPGSKLYVEALKDGLINTQDWSMFEQNYSVLDLPSLPAKRIMELRTRIYRRFYLRPTPIFRTLRRLRTPADWFAFFKMVKDFLTWI